VANQPSPSHRILDFNDDLLVGGALAALDDDGAIGIADRPEVGAEVSLLVGARGGEGRDVRDPARE
jgi:hypothetical protein